jgi:transcriptional regulator with XRE-family HTH domain
MADPIEPPALPFGQRLRAHRERAGKTRAVLGGLVGRSEEWVKAVESGRLQMPRLPLLVRLVEVLGISDLAELTGDQSMQVNRVAYAEHPASTGIRDVVYRYQLLRPAGEPEPIDILRSRLVDAWAAWHGSRTRRTDVGAIIPQLLADCQHAALAFEGPDRRAAHALLANAYTLAQHVLVNATEPELLWLLVERGMAAAQIADDPMSLAGAAWTVGMMLRVGGRADEALSLATDAAGILEPYLPDAPDDWRGMWGALQLHAALTSARAGRDGEAWAFWDRSAEAVRALPPAYAHGWTKFGGPVNDLTAVSLTVDLWKSREALRRAEQLDPAAIPSRERRGRLFVEMARGHHVADERIAAANLLLAACDEGVDAVRYSPAARAILDDLRERPPRSIREEVRTLSIRVGLDAT